jgi:predicted TIM-barrel fold metal-dependent hydrolase
MRLTRRNFGKLTAASAAVLVLPRRARAAAAIAMPPMPPGAVDTHIHIMGPQTKYPYAPTRVYSPPEASVDDLRALRRRLGVVRNVIVTPSVYGFNNDVTIDSIAALQGTARGVAVLPPDIPAREIGPLEAYGIRGTRLNTGLPDLKEQLAAFAPKFRPFNWHVQIVGQIQAIVGLSQQIAGLGIPVVLDHFGGARGEDGVNNRDFQGLLELVKAGNTYVKLSAPYDRTKEPGYASMTAFARALIAARPDRMLWGTNWPHPSQDRSIPITQVSPYQTIDNELLVRRLMDWCPDGEMRKAILVDNPVRLYRFA